MTKPFNIPKALIWEAFKKVKENGGAPGVDHESIEQFEKHLKNNLYKLWNRLCSGSYFPPPVKAVPIPKKSGGVRILGIPTVADRVAQTAVKLLLEPKIDPLFHPNSYGYRPGRSAHDAIAIVGIMTGLWNLISKVSLITSTMIYSCVHLRNTVKFHGFFYMCNVG